MPSTEDICIVDLVHYMRIYQTLSLGPRQYRRHYVLRRVRHIWHGHRYSEPLISFVSRELHT